MFRIINKDGAMISFKEIDMIAREFWGITGKDDGRSVTPPRREKAWITVIGTLVDNGLHQKNGGTGYNVVPWNDVIGLMSGEAIAKALAENKKGMYRVGEYLEEYEPYMRFILHLENLGLEAIRIN